VPLPPLIGPGTGAGPLGPLAPLVPLLPPLVPPLGPPPGPPLLAPPPALLPLPPLMVGETAAEVPLIPEADSGWLLAGGLVALSVAGLLGRRRQASRWMRAKLRRYRIPPRGF
jgi:LPXTG-motif cell wall-anchored protein